MDKSFGQELIGSLNEAIAHANGEQAGAGAHVVKVPDMRSLRETLKMPQIEFARAYRILLPTLKD